MCSFQGPNFSIRSWSDLLLCSNEISQPIRLCRILCSPQFDYVPPSNLLSIQEPLYIIFLLKTIRQPHIPLRGKKKKILTKASTTYPIDLVIMVTLLILQQAKLSPTQVLCISFSFCLEFPFPKLTHGPLLQFFQITKKISLTILYKAVYHLFVSFTLFFFCIAPTVT